MAPETWIAVGNCFSLVKEIDNSLKFFSRAKYLRSDYSYAFTLSGHEYSQNEVIEYKIRFFLEFLIR